MARVIAYIPTDLDHSRLGLPSLFARHVGGKSVLQRTIDRVARIKGVDKIVLAHPTGQDPRPLLDSKQSVELLADAQSLRDPHWASRTAGRKWSLASWRGGLGGMTCYDELLPAAPILEALKTHNADAALLVGADWLLVDP